MKNEMIKYNKNKELICNFIFWVGWNLVEKRIILGLYFFGIYLCFVCGIYSVFKESFVNGKMLRELGLRYLIGVIIGIYFFYIFLV